jgi:hypothetical protein
MTRLTDGELDRVGTGFGDDGDGALDVLDAAEKRVLVEESMVDRDVEATAGAGMEETIEAE